MKKTVLYSLMVLMVVLGVTLSMALPAVASEISASKERDPDEAPYGVGETIEFVMTIANPEDNSATNTLTRIWDTLPDGTVIEFLGTNETLVQTPGASDNFTAQYTVRVQDIVWIELLNDWGVVNTFEAQGYDSEDDDVYILVTSNTRVIREVPPVGGTALPVSRLAILAPWIGLAVIIAGAVVFARRRQTQS